jgi:serine/threonine protein kinase
MALSTAHKHQLIHRDVKPHNILISEGDHAKISDFGIAQKIVPEEADTKVKKKTDDGSKIYSISFKTSAFKGCAKVHGKSGKVIEWKKKF